MQHWWALKERWRAPEQHQVLMPPQPALDVIDDHGADTVVEVADPTAVPAILAAAMQAGNDVRELTFIRPTLADAFFALTGHGLRDHEDAAAMAG